MANKIFAEKKKYFLNKKVLRIVIDQNYETIYTNIIRYKKKANN